MGLRRGRRLIKKSGLGLVGFLLVVFLSYYLPARPDVAKPLYLQVKYVVDGDTVVLSNGDKIRLIGVDTPESHQSAKLDKMAARSHKSKEYIVRQGHIASNFTKDLVMGRQVRVEFDPANENTKHRDKYGRTLAYLYVLNGPPADPLWVAYEDPKEGTVIDVNATLVNIGYAEVYQRFPFKYKAKFLALEQEARENKRGFWNK